MGKQSVVVSGRAPNRTGRSSEVSRSWDPMTLAFMTSLEPVTRALNFKGDLRDTPEADTGADHPSTKDISLRVELGTMLSFYNRQLNGPIIVPQKNAKGEVTGQREYDGIRKMHERTQENLGKLRDDLLDPNLSTTAQLRICEAIEKAEYWDRVNEAKVAHYENMLGALNTVYTQITNETWAAPKAQTKATTLDNLSDEEKKTRIAAAIESAKKAKISVSDARAA